LIQRNFGRRGGSKAPIRALAIFVGISAYVGVTAPAAVADAPLAPNTLAAEGAPAAPINYNVSGLITAPTPPVNTNGINLINGPDVLTGEDRLNVLVGDQESYDDNLFRIPSSFPVGTTVSPNASRGDDINNGYLGLDGQWTVGRQIFDVNVRATENRFSHNSNLNDTSTNAEGLWNWEVGSFLSGQAGVIYTHSLAAFAATRYFGRDMVTATQYFGSFRFELGPHWAVLGGVRQTDTNHSAFDAGSSDFRSKTGNIGIEYAFSADNTVGIQYLYTDGHYPNEGTLNNVPFDFDYKDNKTLVIVKYAVTEKTLLDFTGGFVRRTYTVEPVGAFSGAVYRGNVTWTPTDKTQLLVSGWHQLQAYLDAQSDYYIANGESITPAWLPTEKLTLNFIASHETQNYIATSPSAIAFGSRHDTDTYEQLGVSYIPWRALTVGLAIRAEQRKSTYAYYTYDDKLVRVNVGYKF